MLGNLLYVFGDNTYGQLGQTLPDNATYADYMINTGRTAEKVFAGANRTEYISGGNVYRAGQGYAKNYTAFEKIENTDSISELSIGDDYTLGVDGYGDIWRWGVMTDDSNFDSQKSSFSTPIKSCYEDGFVDIDSRRTQTIGITDSNKLVAWGKGYYGDGTDKETIHYYPKEIELNYGAVPKSVVRGKNLNLVIDQNGDVWGFGSNTNNPMGNLGGKVKTPTCLSGIDDVKSAAAGDGFSIFLKNDGTLWGMGLNSSGQLGQGNTIDTTTPVQITDKDDFLEVDAGDGFVVAIAEDGIYTFGANENGQLGIGSTENALSPQKLNVEFDILYEKFIDVSASTNYCLALTNKGNVYAWGRNGSGQLGIGNKTNQTTPQKVSALSDIVYINAENVQSFAIKKDGTVYGWGHGSNYQLASENTGTCQSPRQITSLKDKDIKKIVCGDGYGIAVSRNGNMYTFGSNVNGALAIYTEEAQEYISDKLDALHWLRNYMDGIGNNITENITLPTSAPNGAAIKWTSSRPGYISETGEVNRPTAYEEDSEVKLTAEIVCENDSIFKNFELTVLKDENNAVIPEIPERVRQNRYDTDSNNKNENYYFDEDDGEDTGGDIEAAGGVDLSYSPVEKARYNNIPSGQRKIPVYLDKRKKITGIIANDSGSNWGVNVISDRVFEGWCVSSEIIEPAGAEDPFYNKNVWVTNKVCSGNQDILLYTTDGKQGTFGLSYFATEPDAYEPNQYEMEAGMFWQFDNESTPTEYNSDKVKKFKANLGSRDKLATKIENLSFDSYADVDVYAVDVNVGDKITVCMEMECAQEEASKYVIGIADNMSDQENYEDEYQKSISYLTDFYYCKSFSYTNLDNTKQTLFATWVANKTERCYIHLGRRGIDGSKGEPVKYNLTTTKTANVKSDPREVKNNSWYTNDFIWINNKEIAEDITVSGGGNGMLDNQLDVDWFKYVAPETGKKKITLNGAGCFAVVRGDKMSNGGKSREYDMVKGQTYYIGVYCPDGMYDGIIKNNNPDYTFSVVNGGSSDSNVLDFTPKSGGKFIYSSNPEKIEEAHLAESGNMLDNYENLSPGKYTYMAWYHNGTSSPIHTDVLFNSNNAQIRINKLGLQVFPCIDAPQWTGIQAYSDFIGKTIDNSLEIHPCNPSVCYPAALDLPKTYDINSNVQSRWLSDIYYNAYGKHYPNMANYNEPIYIIMEFEVLSGSTSLSTIAYKTTSDKTKFILYDAPYVQDVTVATYTSGSPTWKGITGFKPIVETNLSHTIESSVNTDGYSIPMVVKNAFGTVTTGKWVTNLNPQNDASAYKYIAESSMLDFDYSDEHDWKFDTKHTSMKNIPEGYAGSNFIPNDTLPYLTLPPGDIIPDGEYVGFKKQQISISQGNYSVENIYNITVTNNTNSAWKFNYRTDSKSGVVVGISADGDEMQYSCSGSFGDNDKYARFVGRTVNVPSKATVNITVSVVLTTGDAGWVNNEFYVSKEY